MTRTLLVALSAVLCMVPWTEGRAQLAEVQPGARIRVRSPARIAGRAVGIMIGRSSDSLTFAREGAAPVPLALRDITLLEVSRGKSRGRGAIRGMVLGGAIGLVLGAAEYEEGKCDGTICSRGTAAELGAIGGVLVGSVLGAAIGVERWERVALPLHVVVLRGPRGAIALAVAAH